MSGEFERAIAQGDVESVRTQLAAGTNPDLRNRHGQTALMIAAHAGHVPIVEMLVAGGAAINAAAKYNLTALMLAIVAGHEDVALRLVRAGGDVTPKGSGAPGFAGKTAYDLALERGLTELCDALPATPDPAR